MLKQLLTSCGVEQSKALRGDIPGAHTKNLFLKCKKGTLWLLVAVESTPVNLKTLHQHFGCGRLSFGSADLLRQVLGVEIPLRTLFESPTLGGFAAAVAALRGEEPGEEAPPLSREEAAEAPLSFSQERLWFLDRLTPGTSIYNIPSPMRVRGPVSPEVLRLCFDEILRRHEALRMQRPAIEQVSLNRLAGGSALPFSFGGQTKALIFNRTLG